MSDPQWILTKNSIMGRVVELMAGLSTTIEGELGPLRRRLLRHSFVLPPNWDTPKISKGEQYQGLPYVILDLPRSFSREHILAIRTMFWWGHYFSVTLHLKGEMQKVFGPALNRHTKQLAAAGFHMATEGDEWRHELEGGHYIPVTEGCYDPGREYAFVKLSATIPLDKWEEAPELLPGLSRMLLQVLTN